MEKLSYFVKELIGDLPAAEIPARDVIVYLDIPEKRRRLLNVAFSSGTVETLIDHFKRIERQPIKIRKQVAA